MVRTAFSGAYILIRHVGLIVSKNSFLQTAHTSRHLVTQLCNNSSALFSLKRGVRTYESYRAEFVVGRGFPFLNSDARFVGGGIRIPAWKDFYNGNKRFVSGEVNSSSTALSNRGGERLVFEAVRSVNCGVFNSFRTSLLLGGGGGRRLVFEAVRSFHCGGGMAKSKFEYVKQFETEDRLMPNCWIVVRIDGKAFHRFTDAHHYMKPNDERGLNLMTRAAQNVMEDFKDIVLSYGQSDEFSFVLHKSTNIYNRRGSKITTNIVSLFAASFVMLWPRYFSTQELHYPPSFDARVVLYPSDQNLKDYLSWRQADCHINNLYNTCFWKLVQERGMTPAQAQERLKGTLSSDKNELLFSDFSMNYNNLSALYRKGTILLRCKDGDKSADSPTRVTTTFAGTGRQMTLAGDLNHTKVRPSTVVLHIDLIGKQFWDDHPDLLTIKPK